MTDPRPASRLPALLTIGRTAEVLAVSPRTVRRLIEAGDLTATRVGRQVRIHPADLQTFLQNSREIGQY